MPGRVRLPPNHRTREGRLAGRLALPLGTNFNHTQIGALPVFAFAQLLFIVNRAGQIARGNFPMSTQSDSTDSSNWPMIRRLLAMSWRYRWGCIKVAMLQSIILAFGMLGIGFTGLGIDEMRYAVHLTPHPPLWPFHLTPPPDLNPMRVIEWIAAAVLLAAVLRAFVDGYYRVAVNEPANRGWSCICAGKSTTSCNG